MAHKGWIALDIDGTITQDKHSTPIAVISYLKDLEQEGWKIAIATGRSFSYGISALKDFDFPFVFIVQNGSLALDMPKKEVIVKKYISKTSLKKALEIFQSMDGDFLIYSGFEQQDTIFYRSQKFSSIDLSYLEKAKMREKNPWVDVLEFDKLDFDEFPAMKAFGSLSKLVLVQSYLQELDLFETSLIKDPFIDGFYILLITDKSVSKGKILSHLFQLYGRNKVICAGDDLNDLSLLMQADVKIAMCHAPDVLKQIADIIAASPSQLGIIPALKMAVK
jgi:Cof subfamily protein (haloacid dehalogenase superfamily)